MTEPNLKDPRTLYHTGNFDEAQQETPAIQEKMMTAPDCGETSYVGYERLKNRRALITGGDSGIGRAVAIAYAREGADVAIQFFPGEEKDAYKVAELIEAAGRKSVLIPADLRDDGVADRLVARAIEELGGLDTLVLNAAQQIQHPSIKELPQK